MVFKHDGQNVQPGDWLDVTPEIARVWALQRFIVDPSIIEDRDPRPVRGMTVRRTDV
jgi:hypothetical protein